MKMDENESIPNTAYNANISTDKSDFLNMLVIIEVLM